MSRADALERLVRDPPDERLLLVDVRAAEAAGTIPGRAEVTTMADTGKRKRAARSTAKNGVFNAPKSDGPKVAVRTPNVPGYANQVDAAKYEAMKTVLLRLMPKSAPGLTQAEMMAAVGRAAPKDVFPKTTYLWWAKCVQLDLEARGELVRDTKAKPLRWWRRS